MATRYEWNDGSPYAGTAWMRTSTWRAQTFTPSVSHDSTYVRLRLRRQSGHTGTFTVSLRNTLAGLPTGDDLVSKSVACISISTGINLYSFSWSPYLLTAGTQYAIVARTTGGGEGWPWPAMEWYRKTGYPSGDSLCSYLGSGDFWTIDNPGVMDLTFYDYGNPIVVITTVPRTYFLLA